MLDAERLDAMAAHAPSQPSVAGWPSITVTMPQSRGSGASSRSMWLSAHARAALAARAARRGPAGMQPVGRGDASRPTSRRLLADQADRLDRLRRDRAGIGDDHLAIRARLAQPIGAVDDAWRSSGVIMRCGCSIGASRAADRPSRRSRRAASCARTARSPHAACRRTPQRMIDGELVDEGRLERREPVLRHADQRRRDRLMRAAFRRQRDARRRRHHHEAGVLVAGVVQRIEAALMNGS
jgi:hypothetical protein